MIYTLNTWIAGPCDHVRAISMCDVSLISLSVVLYDPTYYTLDLKVRGSLNWYRDMLKVYMNAFRLLPKTVINQNARQGKVIYFFINAKIQKVVDKYLRKVLEPTSILLASKIEFIIQLLLLTSEKLWASLGVEVEAINIANGKVKVSISFVQCTPDLLGKCIIVYLVIKYHPLLAKPIGHMLVSCRYIDVDDAGDFVIRRIGRDFGWNWMRETRLHI